MQGLQADYTLGDWRSESQVHVNLIRSRLTKNLSNFFPVVMDEIESAFADEFKSVPASGARLSPAMPKVLMNQVQAGKWSKHSRLSCVSFVVLQTVCSSDCRFVGS